MIKPFLLNDKRDYTCMFLQIKNIFKKWLCTGPPGIDETVCHEKKEKKNIKAENVNKSSTKSEGSVRRQDEMNGYPVLMEL